MNPVRSRDRNLKARQNIMKTNNEKLTINFKQNTLIAICF